MFTKNEIAVGIKDLLNRSVEHSGIFSRPLKEPASALKTLAWMVFNITAILHLALILSSICDFPPEQMEIKHLINRPKKSLVLQDDVLMLFLYRVVDFYFKYIYSHALIYIYLRCLFLCCRFCFFSHPDFLTTSERYISRRPFFLPGVSFEKVIVGWILKIDKRSE